MIHICYGYGKGKTTCALGLGMRAAGAGKRVSMVQFLKDCNSSELSVLPFDIFKAPAKLPFNPDSSYQKWVNDALDFVVRADSEVIILDEFLDICDKFVPVSKALELMNTLKNKEIIITGHKEVSELFAVSDYITHMEKIRHPYDKGVRARKGIEY